VEVASRMRFEGISKSLAPDVPQPIIVWGLCEVKYMYASLCQHHFFSILDELLIHMFKPNCPPI
jgi:hypothetical protein